MEEPGKMDQNFVSFFSCRPHQNANAFYGSGKRFQCAFCWSRANVPGVTKQRCAFRTDHLSGTTSRTKYTKLSSGSLHKIFAMVCEVSSVIIAGEHFRK